MSSELLLDVEDHSKLSYTMTDDTGDISIDQDGEWDINLFDELDGLCDADELLRALVSADCAGSAVDLNLDIDPPEWSSEGWAPGSSPTGLSPSHSLNSSSPSSVEAHSPYSPHDDAHSPLSPESQPSPLSVCSDSSGFVEQPVEYTPAKKTNQTRAKSVQTSKRPIQLSPKVSIQPKPLVTAVALPQVATALQAKAIIIQPVQTTILPVVKPSPISIQPAPPAGSPVLMSPPTQVLQLHPSQGVATRVLTVPALGPDGPAHMAGAATPPLPVAVSFQAPPSCQAPSPDDHCSVSRRQQRMIKNRESASLSRRKKKEYLLTLETRLKVALCENEKLKSENGTLKRQLEGLKNENTVLKATAPKRRAVCLMVVLVFLVFNVGPMVLFQDTSSTITAPGPGPNSRHLLDFSPETHSHSGISTDEWEPSHTVHRQEGGEASSEGKALMVVKPPLFRPASPCQPAVNKTKCMKMASELKGWVHRHETERTKGWRGSGRGGGGGHHRGRTIPRASSKKVEVAVALQYSASSEKGSGNELQVYYAPRHIYSDFFDEINRRGDTFYVVSFRRDHLLLPATNHNKGSRPKMSLVLPAVKVNDSVIEDKDFEVMMQIDCEVMDTRILHIKASSVPPVLRVNDTRTDAFYSPTPSSKQPTAPVGVLVGSA